MLVALLMKPEERTKSFRLQSTPFVELVKEMHFTVVIYMIIHLYVPTTAIGLHINQHFIFK